MTSTSPVLERTVSESRKFDAGVFDVSFVNRSDSDNSDSTSIIGYIFRVEENITEIYFVAQVVKNLIVSVCFGMFLRCTDKPMRNFWQ